MSRSSTLRLLTVAGVALAAWAGLYVVGKLLSPWAEEEFVQAIEERFASDAEVQDVQVRVFPWFRVEAQGLVFRHHGRTDVPPLLQIERVKATANPLSLLLFQRVAEVRLEGLQIRVARKNDDQSANETEGGEGSDGNGDQRFVVSHVVADGTHLEILSKHHWKRPLVFDLKELELWNAGPGKAMRYESVMTNPKPPGNIEVAGGFGPWNADAPSQTALDGDYIFADADLSHFDGIAGILSSEGSFEGVLKRIEVQGWTDTPDFRVSSSDRPVHLKTDYWAVVDGTSGDTCLEPVIARFERSQVVAAGKVAQERGLDGKSVVLEVRVDQGQVEDMLKLAVPAEDAVLDGPIQFTADFRLPPGEPKVPLRLELDGSFGMQALSSLTRTCRKSSASSATVLEESRRARPIRYLRTSLAIFASARVCCRYRIFTSRFPGPP